MEQGSRKIEEEERERRRIDDKGKREIWVGRGQRSE